MPDLTGLSPFAIPGAEQGEFVSRDGRRYRIMTWSPAPGAVPDAGCPVLYLLDANAAFGTAVETVRLLSQGPRGIAPFAVVGIGYPTDQPLDRDRRFFDYTVEAGEDDPAPGQARAAWPPTGGAPQFLRFIEEELKPLIERRLPVDRSRQMLLGHSLGGWFVLYTMLTKPEAFRYYAAGSPSIWWKRYAIVELARRWTESPPVAPPSRVSLFIGAGEQERPHMAKDARRMYELLSARAIPGFTVAHHRFAGENHLSVVAPFIVRAVRWAAADGADP